MGKSMFGYSSGNRASRFAYDMMVLEETEKENKVKQAYEEKDFPNSLNDYNYYYYYDEDEDEDIFEEDLD